MDWETITKELSKKLDPQHVKTAKGVNGSFIEGWHAIDEANRIFGFNGWSYEINSLTQACSPTTNQNGNHVVAYICQLQVTVDGVIRTDVGYGSGIAKNLCDAHEGATKEAVTDALKRALRTFGNQFGLALYDKAKANVGVDAISASEQRKHWESVKDVISNNLLDAKTVEDCSAIWKEAYLGFAEYQMQTHDWKSVLTNHIQPRVDEIETAKEAAE